MKKILVIAASAAMAMSVSAQGNFNGSTGAGNTAAAKFYQYGGTAVLGTSGLGQWYVGAATITAADVKAYTDNVDKQLPATDPLKAVGVAKAFNTSGFCQAGTTDSGFPVGGSVVAQLRVWQTPGATDWATGSSAAGGYHGYSSLVTFSGLVSGLATPPSIVSPTPLGFTGMTLVPNVPEPSTIALGVLGLTALLFRRRK